MGDDIKTGRRVCFDFCQRSAYWSWEGQILTLDNNLSLNPNRCHHPLFTQLSWNILENFKQCDGKLAEVLDWNDHWPCITTCQGASWILSKFTSKFLAIIVSKWDSSNSGVSNSSSKNLSSLSFSLLGSRPRL